MSNLKLSKQMSESIKLGVILAIAGGFMDAYSYMCRGKVFANAQTGNILLLGINISERNWQMALRYLVPVLAFAIGIKNAAVIAAGAADTINSNANISVQPNALCIFALRLFLRLACALVIVLCLLPVKSVSAVLE